MKQMCACKTGQGTGCDSQIIIIVSQREGWTSIVRFGCKFVQKIGTQFFACPKNKKQQNKEKKRKNKNKKNKKLQKRGSQ